MNAAANILSVTQADFAEKVLAKSQELPVLVDFWADWCGPCHMLMPVLQRLVDAYAGGFVLAKVNTDQDQALATQYGVRSLPTVKLFKDGAVVDEFMGVQSEQAIRELLDRHVQRASDEQRQAARQAREAGEHERALSLLEAGLAADAANHALRLDLADLRLERGEAGPARELLQALPHAKRQEPAAKALLAKADFVEVAAAAPAVEPLTERLAADPGDLEARHGLAAHWALAGRYDAAMEQLLELMKRDRRFRDDAGRQGLLAVFELLGADDQRVRVYRSKMASLLY